MPYKGGDLNLRLAAAPVAREATVGAARSLDVAWRRSEGGTTRPITVDEVVLACCNCAFDVALFHGSGEVRLEHLLHALTRVAAAAQVLTGLGVRTDVLRRETAVAIAADAPAPAIGAEGSPRVSAAVEDTLRRAADLAEPRPQAVSVQDVVRAVLGGGPDSPAAALLMRAAADPQRLERWRDEPRRQALGSTLAAEPVAARAAELPTAAAGALNERLDRMEASFRAVREEAASDRRLTAELLSAVQVELQALSSQGPRVLPADLSEAITAVLEAKLGKFDGAISALATRLGALEAPAAGEGWQALEGRLAAIEEGLTAPAPDQTSAFSSLLSARLAEAEARLQPRLQPLVQGIERQAALAAQMLAALQAAEEAAKARDRRLVEILQAVASLGASQQTLAHSLAAWRVELGGDVAIVSNRLEQMQQTMLGLLEQLNGAVHALRLEHLENGARRGHGFKRWLYGTGDVFATSWREDADRMRSAIDRPRPTEKS